MAEGNAWSELLQAGARSNAAERRRTVVLLGEPQSGKANLLHRLAGEAGEIRDAAGPLRCACMDLAHGGVPPHLVTAYTLHSSSEPVLRLLPYAFSPVQVRGADIDASASLARVQDALFLIVLDMSRPWALFPQLATWLRAIDRVVNEAHAPGADAMRAAAQEQLAQHLHNYMDPSEEGSAEPLPLADGTLRHNLGVPIVFVCTKVDAAEALVRERRISEAQLDYVQQVLRTVAVLYGAALVATSEARPETFETLRAYVRHRLFATPFTARPSAVELASLLVPSGWDSWAQIRVLSERFDCAAFADTWAAELAGDERGVTPLVAQMLPAPGEAPVPGAAQRVVLPDEAEFLRELYERQEADAAETPPATDAADSAQTRNVMGPSLHTSTLDMPEVGRALEEQQAAPPPESKVRPQLETPTSKRVGTPSAASPTTPKQSEVLHSFFQSLLKKPSSSPPERRPRT